MPDHVSPRNVTGYMGPALRPSKAKDLRASAYRRLSIGTKRRGRGPGSSCESALQTPNYLDQLILRI